MTGWLLTVALPALYAAAGYRVARSTFARKRPFTEPLSCGNPEPDDHWRRRYYSHEHSRYCYQRPGTIVETAAGAAGLAIFYGIGWPVTLICVAALALATSLAARWTKPTHAEVAAKIERLERDTGQPS